MSQREAYRAAYSCKRMKPETIDKRACELLKDGKVAGRYDSLMDEIAKAVQWDRQKAAEVLLEAQAIARAKIRQSDMEYTDPDTGEKHKPRDLPREAARFVSDSTAELNKMFGIYDKADGDGAVPVIIDNIPRPTDG